MAINNWSPDKIKSEVNKLPAHFVLERKHISQSGVFNTKNSKEVILANLNRKFKKSENFTFFPVGALSKKDYEFTEKNNIDSNDFKPIYYVRNKHGALILIGIHIDPTSKGNKVYYLASDIYTIESDGIAHTTKKEFEDIIRKFKETVNQ